MEGWSGCTNTTALSCSSSILVLPSILCYIYPPVGCCFWLLFLVLCSQVPKQCLSADTVVEDVNTGCRGCATGAGGNKNIFGNKYGQYLAAIQVSLTVALPLGKLLASPCYSEKRSICPPWTCSSAEWCTVGYACFVFPCVVLPLSCPDLFAVPTSVLPPVGDFCLFWPAYCVIDELFYVRLFFRTVVCSCVVFMSSLTCLQILALLRGPVFFMYVSVPSSCLVAVCLCHGFVTMSTRSLEKCNM